MENKSNIGKRIAVTIDVDTSKLDRIVIGGRMYDALTMETDRISFNSIIGYDKEDETITIKEAELLKLIQFANKYYRDSRIKLI